MPASAPDERHRYLLRNAPFASPFDRAFAWHVPEPLRLAEMAEAAAYYGGRTTLPRSAVPGAT